MLAIILWIFLSFSHENIRVVEYELTTNNQRLMTNLIVAKLNSRLDRTGSLCGEDSTVVFRVNSDGADR